MKRIIAMSLALGLTVWAGAALAQQGGSTQPVPASPQAATVPVQKQSVSGSAQDSALDITKMTPEQRRKLITATVTQISVDQEKMAMAQAKKYADMYDKLPADQQKQMLSAIMQQLQQNPVLKDEVLQQLKAKKIDIVSQPQGASAQH